MSKVEMRVGDFVVMSAADAPAGKWGGYRRLALLELVPGAEPPKTINRRASQVRRVVRTWDRLYAGTTERSAFARALDDAKSEARERAGVL